MAKNDTYTTGLKNFIANNQVNAGYVTTETNISSNDLVNRIQQIINDSEAGYVQRSELKRVAFSNSYNDLFDKPTLLSICSSASINDLVDFPQLDPIATTGDWQYIKNKPTIPTAIGMNDIDLEIDTKVGDAIAALKGSNLGNDYDTLVKLQNKKSEIKYINVTAAPYNLTNFGHQSFSQSSHKLVDDIINNFIENKIIILLSNYGNFIVTNIYDQNNFCEIGLIKFESNYSNVLIQYEIDQPGTSFDEYLFNHMKLIFNQIYIIYDKTKTLTYYILLSDSYTTASELSAINSTLTEQSAVLTSVVTTNNGIIETNTNLNADVTTLQGKVAILESDLALLQTSYIDLDDRITALENQNSNNNSGGGDPESGEPTEPEEP